MKECPECNRIYHDETLNFCLDDGAELVYGPATDEPATAILVSGDVAGGRPEYYVSRAATAPTAVLPADHRRPIVRSAKQRVWFALGFVALSLSLGVVGYRYLSFDDKRPIDSIAVLPFVNDGSDPDVEYLSDGVTENTINTLSRLPNLRVVPRNTVFYYKNKPDSPQTIGRQLGVRAVLTGKVVKRGDTLSIQTELIDVEREAQVWGKQFNRPLADLINLQDEIARAIVDRLGPELTPAERQELARHDTESNEAYQLYLKGQYHWNKFSEDGLKKSVEYYNQALDNDPNYALAYVGLSQAYAVLGNNYMPPREAYPKSRAFAAKALEIDDSLAQAHIAMAAVRMFYDWDWKAAEDELNRATALDPDDAQLHVLHGYYLVARGRLDEAKTEMKRAKEIDPLSLVSNAEVAGSMYFAREYNEAIDQAGKTIDFDPHFFIAYQWLGAAYEQKGMLSDAVGVYQKGIDNCGRFPFLAPLGHAYAKAGQRDKALDVLNELKEIARQRYTSPYLIALIYVGLGDREETLNWLEKTYDDRGFQLIWLGAEPRFDPLRRDPRFAELLQKVRPE